MKSPLVLPGREHGLRRIIDEACAPERLELNVVAEIEALSSVKQATLARSAVMALVCEVVRERVDSGAWPAQWVGG